MGHLSFVWVCIFGISRLERVRADVWIVDGVYSIKSLRLMGLETRAWLVISQ